MAIIITFALISTFLTQAYVMGQCYQFHKVTGGLGIPLAIEFPKTDPFRKLAIVAERAGKVHLVNLVTEDKELLLDLSSVVLTSEEVFEERGLLGLALDPYFHNNRILYVAYSNASNDPSMDHKTIISRFFTDVPPEQMHSSQEIILEIEQPSARQNGGQLFFGPDGYLYLATGDSGRYESRNSLKSLLGKILRINVNKQIKKYTVPIDNPFARVKLAGIQKEIFAYGFRNPWRCSVDVMSNQSGDEFRIFCGDVGDSERHVEDIDLVVAGGQYGLTKAQKGCGSSANCQLPIYSYSTNDAQAVIGGIFYRGTNFPHLNNKYLFGDFINGSVHALTEGKSGWKKEDICVKFVNDCNHIGTNCEKTFLLGIAANHNWEIFALGCSMTREGKVQGFIFKLQNATVPIHQEIPSNYSPSIGFVSTIPHIFLNTLLVKICTLDY